MKFLKSPTHIHFFDEKFYRFETVFCIMILGFSPCFICVLCRVKILLQIYTRIIASLKPPPLYTRIIREENFAPDIYEKLRCVRNPCAIDWALVSLCSFVSCFIYAVIVWIRSFLLIGRCQNSIVKVWSDCINSL